MKRNLLLTASLLLLASCGGGGGGGATDTGGGVTPTASLTFVLPIAEGDSAQVAYGIWPFGVHGGGHAADGHPGIDVEFAIGASVRAGADGTIQSIFDDTETPGRHTIAISHNGGSLRTDYTNVGTLFDGIVVGAAVVAGQPLGIAGAQTIWIGSAPVTFAMTHYQIDDFAVNDGLSNPFAVSPYDRLTPTAKSQFDSIWQGAAYRQELCEPYPGNDRGNVANPVLARTWTKSGGGGAAKILFTCDSGSGNVTYRFQDDTGASVEEGSVSLTPRPGGVSSIDFVGSGGTARGLYDIVSGSMTLAYGSSRPTSLDGASTYTTD
ncbi:MAG: peptidoglycan DD-metalloendopeptidase family protein [Nitrospinae bacterium]|nr:peptidoglycan DD-metalloendopeptidase family protein [Nitrospinota bacterium]